MKQKPRTSTSLVSEDLEIDGDLHCFGEVIIQGSVSGNVRGHLVTIGETGRVRGELEADDMIISGDVRGPILSVKLNIASTASIVGNIYYRIIEIQFGAKLAGSLARTNPQNDLEETSVAQ